MPPSEQNNSSSDVSSASPRHALAELAALFLRLGLTAFGGPAAHIAMMEDEVVRRRRWLTHAEFLDLLGATNLIPGPNSTEMAIHIGHRRAGFPGLVVAGASFIFPAGLIVLACAWVYARVGALPRAEALFFGIKPVIIAVVVQALIRLARSAIKTRALAALCLACAVASALGVNELAVLFAAGALVAIARGARAKSGKPSSPALFAPFAGAVAAAAPAALVPFSLSGLFVFFLKVGSVLFGSGYVLLAFLRADLVDRYNWLSESQLLDAIAVGQITPGPVFTTATFIGYLLGGPKGALVATLGIFVPAFVFVAISGPLVPRIRQSLTAGAFLDGVNVASLALMAVVTAELGRAAIVDVPSAALAGLSALLLLRYQLNSAWLVLGGAAAGIALRILG